MAQKDDKKPPVTLLTKTPKVSVIMNCFNGAKYLREAIDSVYAQTYDNWEIIFWDNNSPDESAKIAQSYDHRVRYFKGNTTVPLGMARNFALEQTSGELVSFLDVDDIWLPTFLEKMVSEITQGGFDVIYSGVIEIDKDGNELRRYIPGHKTGNLFEALLWQWEIPMQSVLVRKSSLVKGNFKFDDSITASEEYCLFMQMAVEGKFCSLPIALAKYRLHGNNLTNKAIGKWAEEREYTLNIIRQRHPFIEDKYYHAFQEAYARAKYYSARYYVLLGDKTKALRELSKTILVNYKYILLFGLLLLPTGLWNLAHNSPRFRRLKNLIQGRI